MTLEKSKLIAGVPVHIGIIPDGNRRWAKEHHLPGFKGHEAGIRKFREILEWCEELGIKNLTFYTFSLENFLRPKDEVSYLMKAIKRELLSLAGDRKVHKNKVRITVIGNLLILPKDVREAAAKVMEATKNYDDYHLNLAIAYGGREEIAEASRRLARLAVEKKIKPEQIDEKLISDNLYSRLPDVDLLIRTSEQRISGFLPWQSTYAEIVFLPETLFPDLSKKDFIKEIEAFSSRERRFGK